MSSVDAAVAWRALVAAASDPYQRAGKFAFHFARGKLRWDPVFGHLLARGLIAPRTRVLDLGRGQGFSRPAGRTLAAWQARLGELGFAVASEALHGGPPFANVLLVAKVDRAAATAKGSA